MQGLGGQVGAAQKIMESFQKGKIFIYGLLVVLLVATFGVGFVLGKNQVVCKACKPESIDFSLFWDAYSKLHESYINPEEIDDKEIIYGAIAGMTESLGDPYTSFFKPEQAKIFQQDLAGSFDGLGIEIGIKKDQLTVIAPLKGMPADRAGIQAGDTIVSVDQKSTADMTIEQVVSLIRGKKGTSVTLTVFREEWNQARDFTIVRETIKINSVEWEIKEDNIAYIRIHQFSQSLPVDFTRVSREILSSPAKKVILDLRNNPGGYLEVCQTISGWFLRDGDVVTIEDFGKDKDPKPYKAEGNGALVAYPMVILINEGSASASEILAGALRDNRNVKLIGEKSFGKGSVQEVVGLQDGNSFLKVTVAKWLTPRGTSISDFGLTPDIIVEMKDGAVNSESDIQLAKALEIIKGIQ